MPIEEKYSIDKVIQALKEYVEKTGRRITVEYILIHGFNDTPPVAKELAILLRDLKCNVNLIPYNSVVENDYKKPSNSDIMKFKYLLEHSGKKVTVRLERGADIDAACGQLRGKQKQNNAT
jgi:23S rRNA (adenine2503-C2)-methyltransferase